MPSAQPKNPYTFLERSFNDAPVFKAPRNPSYRRDEIHDFFPALAPLRPGSYAYDDASTETSDEDSTFLVSPPVINGHIFGLPPTPPSALQDRDRRPRSSTQEHAGVVPSLLSRKSSIKTPLSQRSPPTPDPSPPRTAEHLTMPSAQLQLNPSSRSDSFTTAKSFQESEEENGQPRFSYSDASAPLSRPPAGPAVQMKDKKLLDMEGDDDDMTPTERNPSGRPDRAATHRDGSRDARRDSRDWEPDHGWDSNLSRNATVRRGRAPKTPSGQTSPDGGASPLSVMKRGAILRERSENSKRVPTDPALEKFANDIGWPNEVNRALHKHLLDTESRRFSIASNTSTVVEAVVVSTPPQHKRTLRHAGKNLALRSSSESRSNRNSQSLEDGPSHRLVHKRSRIPDKRNRDSIGSDHAPNVSATSSPVSTRKRQNSVPVLVIPAPEGLKPALAPRNHVRFQLLTDQIQSQLRTSATPDEDLGYFDVPKRAPRKKSADKSSSPSKSKRREQPPPTSDETKRRSFTAPSGVTGGSDRITLEYSPKGPKRESFRRSAANKPGVRSKESLLSTPDERETSKPLPPVPTDDVPAQPTKSDPASEERPRTSPQTQSEQDKLTKRAEQVPQERPVSSPQERTSPEERPHRMDQDPHQSRPADSSKAQRSPDRTSERTEEIVRPGIDRALSNRSRRRSLDSTGFSPLYTGRTSFDRSTIRTDDHSMVRHHWTQTPFSQMSDTGDPLEVSEATAVSIYPHNNHSLLVVQQVARAGTVSHRRAASSPESALPPKQPQDRPATPPILTIGPPAPPEHVIANIPTVTSPLKNPRKPPEPPAFKIIPPTPAEEIERELAGPSAPQKHENRGPPPTRRQNLVQRARRYSDTIIQPILRNTSIRRNINPPNPDPQRVPSVSSEKQKADENNLHPFWKPRGFWDDFSGSDSEDDLAVSGAPTSGTRSGNTSNIDEQYRDLERAKAVERQRRKIGALGRRITTGFKGSGGFLIGNSLGVERHGTNNRRHHVDAPSGSTSSKAAPAPRMRGGGVGGVRRRPSKGSLRSGASAGSATATSLASASGSGAGAASGAGRRSPPFASPAQARARKNRRRELGGNFSSSSLLGEGAGAGAGSMASSTRLRSPPEGAKGGAVVASSSSPSSVAPGAATAAARARGREVRIPRLLGKGGKGWSVEYVGLSGLRDKFAERKAEKRRQELRGMIGSRFYWEGEAGRVA
ncbi:uncharacterized protein K452DRAFT_151697 [Aplosporella prunicola CBS 121167]|uniref:Uncharacterized protein n=1 Tax=Aplosporella prunicola CBS 121167 TaxID=1176127 RepID=A0A6A6BIR1_9PEZI|nr:uncharacterized protein K452DRAFT_151697 [Aplosporella prunicola CBS 121167]KAF2144032.1 hypothetical protein K452DRAFT_151697 [Aplosporella prunicola CBS 121167]